MMKDLDPPINWTDYEDIAGGLYERFGNDYTDLRIQNTPPDELVKRVLELRSFAGNIEDVEPGIIFSIRNAWIEEWRNNQKPSDSHVK